VKSWQKGTNLVQIERAEEVVRNLITDIEERILVSTDSVEVAALKSVVYFLEDNWAKLMSEIEWRLEV